MLLLQYDLKAFNYRQVFQLENTSPKVIPLSCHSNFPILLFHFLFVFVLVFFFIVFPLEENSP